ncbi:MAG: dihydroxyacetone kinase subunit DhaL [Mesorhizobium sp.]
MDRLNLPQTISMLRAVAQSVIDNTDVLTDADLAIGDGDHGVGMRRGFEAALTALDEEQSSIEDAHKAVGMAVLSETGGAAGAIFGTLFRSGARAYSGKDEIDDASFAEFLDKAVEAMLKRGGVVEGQKTIIDAAAPAARAARKAAGAGLDKTVGAAAEGALAGVEATKAMVATTGKARSLGERSVGHPDPGAISASIILVAMRDYITAG